MSDNNENKNNFISQLLPRNIADIYVINICIYHPLIKSCISEINSQHSMLALHGEIMFTIE